MTLRVETTKTPFTSARHPGQLLRIPVAHGEGCYFADRRTLDALEAEDRVVLRYVDNPNGSLRDIAGICNERRNVMGLMPHPERAADVLMGSTDGRVDSRKHGALAGGMQSTPHERPDALRARQSPFHTQARTHGNRNRDFHRDVERALLLQKLPPAFEEASDAGRARAARARARTRGSSISATAGPSRSRSNPTIIRASSSRFRARPPASAESCATFSPWARGLSR